MFKYPNFIPALFIIVILGRMLLSFLPAMEGDQIAYRYFSNKLANNGIEKFYSTEGFNLNSLGYLYILWFIGIIKNEFIPNLNFFSKDYDLLLKIPSNLSDILIGFILFMLIKSKTGTRWATAGFLMYTLNPAVFFNSSIWGQYDSISTLFIILSVLSITFKKNTILSSALFAIALSLKPQAIFFAPILAILTIKDTKPLSWILALLTFVAATALIYFPFFQSNPIYGIYSVNSNLGAVYTCTTCFAFNFWGMFGNWKDDMQKFLGFPIIIWSIILLSLNLLLIIFRNRFSERFRPPYSYLTISVIVMAFFIFLTRMHERYLFPLFPFLLLSAIMLKSRQLIVFYLILSILNFLNLLTPYLYYNQFFPDLTNILTLLFRPLSFISLIAYLYLLIFFLKNPSYKSK